MQAPLQKTRKFRWPPSVTVNDALSLIVSQALRGLAKGLPNVDYDREPPVGGQFKMHPERTLLDRLRLEVAIEVQSGLADCDDGRILGQPRKLRQSVLGRLIGAVGVDSDGGEQPPEVLGKLDCAAA